MTDGIASANANITPIRDVGFHRCRTFFSIAANRQLSADFDSGIGVHLNAKGQLLWARTLADRLRK